MTKFIFVTGGVISGVGKGITTASIGKILKTYGYSITLIKIDPYINYDAGTLRPTEHGEVWVTDDGGEIDQDLGTYERFLDQNIPKQNNMTTGQIYQAVIEKERRGEYLGATVQFIPHIPDEITRRILKAAHGFDIAIIEIGGTVGDYENAPFLFAARMLERDIGSEHVAHVLVSYLPIPKHIKEMKTKPTQQAIKLLREEGIFPDFIICRAEQPVDDVRKKKIEQYAHIAPGHVISAPDLKSVYQVPLNLEKEELGKKMLRKLCLKPKKEPDWSAWKTLVARMVQPKKEIRIGIIGKYVVLGDYHIADSYVSVEQALNHAGAELDTGINITWLDANEFEQSPEKLHELKKFDGIIVPGGFGETGVEGKIRAIEYVRTNDIPFLGLCLGMQLAVVEFARTVCGLSGAHTTEVDSATPYPVITVLPTQKEKLEKKELGGSMRLGAYSAVLKKESRVFGFYEMRLRHGIDTAKFDAQVGKDFAGERVVLERHRHRYEINPAFVDRIEKAGLTFSGYHQRKDGTKLMEFIELPEHAFFVATQAHPEFKSRLSNPSPLFYGFVKACA